MQGGGVAALLRQQPDHHARRVGQGLRVLDQHVEIAVGPGDDLAHATEPFENHFFVHDLCGPLDLIADQSLAGQRTQEQAVFDPG